MNTKKKTKKQKEQVKHPREIEADRNEKLNRIPKQLRNPNYRFIKIAMSGNFARKKPLEKDWQNARNYFHDDPTLIEYISKGNNFGVVCGYGNLAVIDADEKEIEDIVEINLQETFTVQTGSGGKHYYFIIPDLDRKIVLHDKDNKHFGEVQFTGSQVILPGCLHPNDKRYKIIKDVPIATIKYSAIKKALGNFIQDNVTPSDHWEKDGEYQDIDISKVISLSGLTKHGNECQGAHPVHGSSTGSNFCINPSKGTWHCFRCNSGGGALSLIALLEGFINCNEAKQGALKGNVFKQVLAIANKKYHIDIKSDKIQTNQEQIIKEILIDDTTKVIHTKDEILYAKLIPEGKGDDKKWVWKPTRIYVGHVKPLVKMVIDEEFTVFKYTGDTEQVADIPTIIRTMKKGGGVLNKQRFDDCLNAIFLDLETIIGHATYGIYENEGTLKLCLDAMPLRDKQKQIKLRGKAAVTQKITKENLKPYFEVLKNWHPYEILPSMAAGGISPFALMLRKRGKIVPIIWNCAPVSRLGKSLVQKIFSLYLFNIFPVTGDGIDSKYRLSTVFDCACSYVIVDEAEQVKWRDLEGILKEAPENFLCNIRGTPEQGMIQYLSRAVLGINSNRFSITSEHVLVRVLKIEFDASLVGFRAGNDSKVDELSEKIGELEPIGWRIAEIYLEDIKNSMDILLERIDGHEKKIKKLTSFTDPRRPIAWAVLYEGLKIWECAAKKFEIEWQAPSYEDFVTKVIDKIEKSTEDTKEAPLDDFLNWWSLWKVLHVDRVRYNEEFIDTPKGKDVLWAEKKLEWKDVSFQGEVVTGAILREYQKEQKTTLDNLADIQKAITQKTGIPKNKLLTAWKIGGKSKWGCFILDDLLSSHEQQGTIPDYESADVKSEIHTKPVDFLKQEGEIEKIQAFISEAGGNNKEVSGKSLSAFIKHMVGKKDPEKYLQKLKEGGIVTDYGNDKIKFTGRQGGGFQWKKLTWLGILT